MVGVDEYRHLVVIFGSLLLDSACLCVVFGFSLLLNIGSNTIVSSPDAVLAPMVR